MLNSDVICEFPFQYLLGIPKIALTFLADFHKAHGGEGTLMTTPVTDPSKYGVVMLQQNSSKIAKFVEKPQEWVGDQINAGIYIFNPGMLSRIGSGPMSIEKDGTLSWSNLST